MKKVFIRTLGCAMNYYDSEAAEGILEAAGYRVLRAHADAAARPVTGESRADIVLLNTCSVREHAEDRVFGRLGQLGKLKKKHPDLMVGLMGCMVEEHREKLFKRFPQLDFMVGTRNIKDLPRLIDEVLRNRRQVARIRQEGISIEYSALTKRSTPFHAWLPIMTGCDKVCTFCIVPKTRGREVSMPADEVFREAARLAADGVKWITLLGQNVNSYKGTGNQKPGTTTKETGDTRFPQLLERLCQIEGIERISFTTSHPSDATPELFEVIARNPKISRRFHLPLQSGSDRILKRMKRLHTYEEFKAKADHLRSLVPEIALTTDMIAGFPGESVQDHEATLRALEEIRFDGAFIYKYSSRPGTPAAKLKDDVPLTVKETRNQELLRVQKKIETANNRAWLGKEITVFVESRSVKNKAEVRGRSDQDKKVVFPGSPELIGSFQKVRLKEFRNETFVAEIAKQG